jgi:uncharacterized protein YciI
MYVVDLTYLKPLDAIEAHLDAHRQYLNDQYASGIFIASGPKNPREGGVILASAKVSRPELDAILEQDPFKQYGLASYRVVEFSANKFHPRLADIL